MSTVLRLKTSDQKTVTIDWDFFYMSEVFKSFLDFCEDVEDEISLENIDSQTVELIKKYCQLTKESQSDWEFFEQLKKEDLFKLVKAADFLEIESLYERCCNKIYNKFINGKDAKKIRKAFYEEEDDYEGVEQLFSEDLRHPLINHSCIKLLTLTGFIDLLNLILACPVSGMMSILDITHCRDGIWVSSIGYVTMIAWTCYCSVQEVMALNRLLEFANKPFCNRLFFGNRSWCWAIYALVYSGLLNTFGPKPFYFYDPYAGGWTYTVIVGTGAGSASSQNNMALLVNGICKSIILVLLYSGTMYFYKLQTKDKRVHKLQKKVTYQSLISAAITISVMFPFIILKISGVGVSKHTPMCLHLLWIAANGSTAYIVIATNPYVKRQLLKVLGFQEVMQHHTATVTPMNNDISNS
uniref:Skp1_POZ domain-containing protein n=2 Tax=Steinernema glaseri TaxID=37863 RepID=A0A1I7ZDZ5_9BILA